MERSSVNMRPQVREVERVNRDRSVAGATFAPAAGAGKDHLAQTLRRTRPGDLISHVQDLQCGVGVVRACNRATLRLVIVAGKNTRIFAFCAGLVDWMPQPQVECSPADRSAARLTALS